MIQVTPAPWPPDFADALARRSARLAGFAAEAEWHESVGSTNDLADRLAAAGAAHGTVVAAREQTQGRGRLGRTWFSPAGAGLYVSVVLRPDVLFGPAGPVARDGTLAGPRAASSPFPTSAANPGAAVTLTAGVALAGALRTATGLPVDIKWPNDLVIEGRKLCGILAEASAAAGTLRHIVLGFGVNVGDASYPREIAGRATSLERECGRAVDPALVLAESLASLAECLRELREAGFAAMLDRWRAWSPSSQSRAVEVTGPEGAWRPAVTAGVAEDGALLVTVGGVVQRVIAGEIRWS